MSMKTQNTAFLTFDYGKDKTGTAVSNSTDFATTESVFIDKTCLSDNYFLNDTLTYIISVTNNSNIPIFNLKIKEDIGNDSSLDLKYLDSFKYYVNGEPREISPPKTYSDKIIFEIDSLSASSNALLIYSASVTENAPLTLGSSIDNNSSLITSSPDKTLKANSNLTVRETADIKVIKQIKSFSPSNAVYSLIIYNYGNIAAENLTISDKSEHIFSKLKIKIDNKSILENDYTYNLGELKIPSYSSKFSISVPEAKFIKDKLSEKTIIMPGTTEVLIEGKF